MGHAASLPEESDDLFFENGRRNLLTEDEFKRGRSKSNISCILLESSDTYQVLFILLYEVISRKPQVKH